MAAAAAPGAGEGMVRLPPNDGAVDGEDGEGDSVDTEDGVYTGEHEKFAQPPGPRVAGHEGSCWPGLDAPTAALAINACMSALEACGGLTEPPLPILPGAVPLLRDEVAPESVLLELAVLPALPGRWADTRGGATNIGGGGDHDDACCRWFWFWLLRAAAAATAGRVADDVESKLLVAATNADTVASRSTLLSIGSSSRAVPSSKKGCSRSSSAVGLCGKGRRNVGGRGGRVREVGRT